MQEGRPAYYDSLVALQGATKEVAVLRFLRKMLGVASRRVKSRHMEASVSHLWHGDAPGFSKIPKDEDAAARGG